MRFFSAIGTALEYRTAWVAAFDTLEHGGSPFDALDVFAGATKGQLDDQVVGELRKALDTAITTALQAAHGAATVVGFLEEHRPTIVAAVDQTIGVAIDVGWRARGWAAKMEIARRARDVPRAHSKA
ncbi:MAG: hypothetical protein KIT14_22560 [bacterium]|nr:hypothetical protein [bacterium]